MRISDWSSDVCSSDLFGKDDLAPIDFDDIAHDRQAKAGPGLGGVQPRAASEQFGPPFFGNAGAVILDQNVDELAIAFHRHKNPAAAVFGGILDQVAEHFLKFLPFARDGRGPLSGAIHGGDRKSTRLNSS